MPQNGENITESHWQRQHPGTLLIKLKMEHPVFACSLQHCFQYLINQYYLVYCANSSKTKQAANIHARVTQQEDCGPALPCHKTICVQGKFTALDVVSTCTCLRLPVYLEIGAIYTGWCVSGSGGGKGRYR